MREPVLFMDMDGVLVDFVGGICRALKKPDPYERPEAWGRWELWTLMGVSEEEFWAACSSAEFWRSLEWHTDGRLLLETVEQAFGAKHVYLFSTPTLSPASAGGKMSWIQEHLPGYQSRTLLGAPKHFCARRQTILVDDRDANVEAFRTCGGGAVLVPRPWNSDCLRSGKAFRHVAGRLAREMCRQGIWKEREKSHGDG